MFKKKKILVVGGTGFIGFHLIKFLKYKNFFITSLSKNEAPKKRKIRGVKYLYFDISKSKNFKSMKKKNFDYVVNLAGYVDHSNNNKTYKSHFLGCKNLANHFKKKKIKSFIQIGSSLEYGKINSPQIESQVEKKPLSVYSKSKLLATKYLLKLYVSKKFPAIILRAYQVYGPNQDSNRLIPTVIVNCLKNKSFDCSSGQQARDFLHVYDFVQAIYKSLNNKKALGNIINIGCGSAIKVKEVIIFIKNIIKKGKPKFNKIELRKDEMMTLYPSIKKSFSLLKWKPKINLFFGLKQTILDYKKTIR